LPRLPLARDPGGLDLLKEDVFCDLSDLRDWEQRVTSAPAGLPPDYRV